MQVFSNKCSDLEAYYAKCVNPITVDGDAIGFVIEAEHVCVLRDISGNTSHILKRFRAHQKALAAVLPLGLARGQHGNPAASLRVNDIYATPVLLSGMASLVLNNSEITMIEKYLKKTSQNLQRLNDKTPACVVAFLGGTLPGRAVIHLKQLTIFGMILQLHGSLLHTYASSVLLSARPSASSWFQQIRQLCLQYQLDHPLLILQNPPKESHFRKLIKSRVVDYWEVYLRENAAKFTSTPYFKPNYMSLLPPHPI